MGSIKVKSIYRIIEDLPLGTSALIEHRVKNKKVTCIIVKDKFKKFVDTTWEKEVYLKGGIIKMRNTLSAHLMIHFKDNFNDKLYPFHFNYYDENSLKLLHNLTKQNKIYIIIGNENTSYILKTFNNSLKPFMKNYIKSTINFGYIWSELEYKKALGQIIKSFNDITDLWDKLGDKIHLEEVKNKK